MLRARFTGGTATYFEKYSVDNVVIEILGMIKNYAIYWKFKYSYIKMFIFSVRSIYTAQNSTGTSYKKFYKN